MPGRQVLLRLCAPLQSSAATALVIRTRSSHLPAVSAQALRFYATPGRPRSTVGEPSRTVKRDVKRQANSTTGKQAVTKKKPKAKPAPKKKKVPTEAQKERQKVKAGREEVARLKKVALLPSFPKIERGISAYSMFVSIKRLAPPSKGQPCHVGAEFRALSPAEREHYNHLAVQETEKRAFERKAFIESHSVEEIRAANAARLALNRRAKTKTRYGRLRDDREGAKRRLSPYILFVKERFNSGDLKGIAMSAAGKLIAQEWKALSADEQSRYRDAATGN